ncbi:hypothetical protein, partial [Vibrio vulnificus]|uniref:hypothetical protein n=1 Tax=Vibrio vulnificus TaxID=672 RepID=UPI001F514FF4
MSMKGELKFFLGHQIKQMDGGIFIYQSNYTMDLIKKFKMEGCKLAKPAMASNLKLEKHDDEEDVDQKLF